MTDAEAADAEAADAGATDDEAPDADGAGDGEADGDEEADEFVDFDLERLSELVESIGDGVTELKQAIVEGAAGSEILETAKDLWEVLEEVEELLETIDLAEVPEAIDFEDLPEAVDVDDVPEGLVDEDESAIELRNVRQAVDLRKLWDAVDLTQLVQEKRELDAAIDDVTDDDDGEEGDGWFDDDEDDGWFDDEDDELFQNVVDTGEGANVQFGKEARQEFLEEKILDAVEKFRAALLTTHEKLRKLYRANQEKLGDPGRQPDSLNPTAASTMPPGPIPDSVSARTSTVPSQVKYSRVKNPRRIYGRRFEEATETGEESADASDGDEERAAASEEREDEREEAETEEAGTTDEQPDEAGADIDDGADAPDEETIELEVYDG